MKSLKAVTDILDRAHDDYMRDLPKRIQKKNNQVYRECVEMRKEEHSQYGNDIPDVPWYTPANERAEKKAAEQLVWAEKQEARYKQYLAEKALRGN